MTIDARQAIGTAQDTLGLAIELASSDVPRDQAADEVARAVHNRATLESAHWLWDDTMRHRQRPDVESVAVRGVLEAALDRLPR